MKPKPKTPQPKGERYIEPSYLIGHFLGWILLFDGFASAKKIKPKPKKLKLT